MISDPSASGGSKINLKHKQREGDSLLEHPIQQFLLMGDTQEKKGESQMNTFYSFIRTSKLFCIEEMFLCKDNYMAIRSPLAMSYMDFDHLLC